mmetsp:Transcript_29664/g.43970  ORF Transcript_29664/g.43970 Transcript_29664/m.43970 type:complete len:223 (+) Transcript_29664:687-1355(+)
MQTIIFTAAVVSTIGGRSVTIRPQHGHRIYVQYFNMGTSSTTGISISQLSINIIIVLDEHVPIPLFRFPLHILVMINEWFDSFLHAVPMTGNRGTEENNVVGPVHRIDGFDERIKRSPKATNIMNVPSSISDHKGRCRIRYIIFKPSPAETFLLAIWFVIFWFIIKVIQLIIPDQLQLYFVSTRTLKWIDKAFEATVTKISITESTQEFMHTLRCMVRERVP